MEFDFTWSYYGASTYLTIAASHFPSARITNTTMCPKERVH